MRKRRGPTERIALIEQALRDCWPRGRIARHFAKQWAPCTERTIRRYITAIVERWEEEAQAVNKDVERALTIDNFGEIYRKAMKAAGECTAGAAAPEEEDDDEAPDADQGAAAGVTAPKPKKKKGGKKSYFAAAAHFRVAIQAMDRRALYQGLRPASTIKVETPDGKPLTVSTTDAAADLAAALDQVAERDAPAGAVEAVTGNE